MDRHVAGAIGLGQGFRRQLLEFGLRIAHELFEVRAIPDPGTQRAGQLRHDRAQVADKRDVDRAVDADRGGILLNVDPLALRLALEAVGRSS